MTPIDKITQTLIEIRSTLNPDTLTQSELVQLQSFFEPYKNQLRAGDKAELVAVVDSEGHSSDLIAPRWLCHLLGLRHRVVHILLVWQSAGMGRVFVFQVRHWNKDDLPGHVDISAGGHVTHSDNQNPPFDTAYREMEEELGIKADSLTKPLIYCGGYLNYVERPVENLYDAEWCDVFVGTVSNTGFSQIHFADEEVVGLYLCPENEVENLITQTRIPMAGAIQQWRILMDLCKLAIEP